MARRPDTDSGAVPGSAVLAGPSQVPSFPTADSAVPAAGQERFEYVVADPPLTSMGPGDLEAWIDSQVAVGQLSVEQARHVLPAYTPAAPANTAGAQGMAVDGGWFE